MPTKEDPEAAEALAQERFAAWLEEHPDGDWHALQELCEAHAADAERFERWWHQLVQIGELKPIAARTQAAAQPDAAEAVDSDDQVGPYRMLEELGRGAQAVVHLAEDTRSGKKVALKILPLHRTQVQSRLQRFRREAELLARVDHAGVCAVEEAGRSGDTLYLAMSYVRGRTLAAWIVEAAQKGGRRALDLPARDPSEPPFLAIVKFFEIAARALHASHEQGLIHRDIKPSNIMVGEQGEPVVLDFGLAREIDDLDVLTLSGDLIGTPAYMSPEQLAAQRIRLDPRTDVYSLGATLYEALTLKRPFDAPTMDRLFSDILMIDPPMVSKVVPELPADLGVVVATCLEKDRNRRYQTALDLAEDLRRVHQSEQVRARRPGAAALLWRWCQRHPLAASFWGTVLVAMAVALWLNAQLRAEQSRFQSVASVMTLRRAQEAEGALYPAWPERVPAMQRWLVEYVEPLAAKRAELAAMLQDSSATESPMADGLSTVELDVEKFVAETQATLVQDIDRFFQDSRRGPEAVRERIEWAQQVEDLSIHQHQKAWDGCRQSLRSSELYGELDLPEQLGLVPIGTNAQGLWEFAHLRSAADPELLPVRDAARGSVRVEDGTGIVFVLIPAGRVDDQDVGAFFLGAHELTKGQWRRMTGADDVGYYKEGVSYRGEGAINPQSDPAPESGQAADATEVEIGETHPVENQTWMLSDKALREQGLRMPTVAERTYAGLAGAAGPWHTGKDKAQLSRHANLAGRVAVDPAGDQAGLDVFTVPAPVGSLLPNDWGLFDIHGNVWEWCSDLVLRGSREAPDIHRSLRGGSYETTPVQSLIEAFDLITSSGRDVGVRPARSVLPRPSR